MSDFIAMMISLINLTVEPELRGPAHCQWCSDPRN
jgi:hypothetical protein